MNKLTIITGLAATGITLLLTGCGTTGYMGSITNGYSVDVTGKAYPKIEPHKVTLEYKDEPNAKVPCGKYETIGQISVDNSNAMGLPRSVTDINTYFKNGAASKGGDAVIYITQSEDSYNGYIIKCEG
jgi:hypothetical protein